MTLNFTALLELVDPARKLTQDDHQKLLQFFKIEKIPSKSVIISEGNKVTKLYWLRKGIARQYFSATNGADKVLNLFVPGDFVTDMIGFVNKKPAVSTIQTLSNVECFSIDIADVEKLFREIPVFSSFIFKLLLDVNCKNILRIKNLLTLNQEARFEQLMKSRPYLMQYFPIKYIAQYLGVAPESLSRVRKRNK